MHPFFSTLVTSKNTAWLAPNLTVNEAGLSEARLGECFKWSQGGGNGRCLQEEVTTDLGFKRCIGVCQRDKEDE